MISINFLVCYKLNKKYVEDRKTLDPLFISDLIDIYFKSFQIFMWANNQQGQGWGNQGQGLPNQGQGQGFNQGNQGFNQGQGFIQGQGYNTQSG